MKILPSSRMAWTRAAVIISMFIAACFYRNIPSLLQLALYEPREGDILFQSLPHGELVDAIEGVTQSPWSHCGILVRKENRWVVIEAIGQVRQTPLALWIMRGRGGRFAAYRISGAAAAPAQAPLPVSLAAALETYMGRPYDFRYAPEDDEIYCSELVYKAYRDASGLLLGTWEELGKLNWKPHEAFIRSMEDGDLPLDRPMITPVALTRAPQLSLVYPKGS